MDTISTVPRATKGSKTCPPPHHGFITTLGNRGDYEGVRFFGSFRALGGLGTNITITSVTIIIIIIIICGIQVLG